MKSPIFLFSLPRSGSTLLQRILMSHKDIASVAEPWIMLPFVYAFKKEGVLTEYSHSVSYVALEDFIKNLPKKEIDYYEALRNFAASLYERLCTNNEKYFLDKTPRYYLIIPQIAKIFPNAKFIFLFRNPVHVLASIIQTWCDGRLNRLYAFDIDLKYGIKALYEGYKLLKDKAYALQYEKLIYSPEKYIKEICEYLEIEFDKNMLNYFASQNTKGRLGDPTGVKRYKTINSEPLNKWKSVLNTKFRKKYTIGYIKKIDEDILKLQGYDKQEILKEIEGLKTQSGIRKKDILDIFDVLYSDLVRVLKPNIWFGETTKIWARYKFLS